MIKSAFEEVGNQEKVDRQQINQNSVAGYEGLVVGNSWELHHEIR
jgi:hypothetical protein